MMRIILNRYAVYSLLICTLTFSMTVGTEAFAASKSSKHSVSSAYKKSATFKKAKRKSFVSKRNRRANYQAPQFAALVVDAKTGHVLYERNAASICYPASLTKMMTLYLTFDALKKGKLRMGDTLPVSAKAASQPQTNIALDVGDRLPLRTAIESVVVRSANDSAMVLAEAIGQTQWNFALLMTQKARQLGMKNTVFKNPNGLPDPGQHTTAYDMARLGIALRRDFPEYYNFFSLTEFEYRGVTYPGHNRVMERYPGADGIKTGYIRASGFNLVTSVKRDKYNIVAVIMGGSSANIRDNQMIDMLDRTFAQLEGSNKGVANQDDTASDQDAAAMQESEDIPIVTAARAN